MYEIIKMQPKNYNKNIKLNKGKTTEQYKNELLYKNPKLELLEEYTGANDKVLHKYIECGHTAMLAPAYALSGKSGCKICRYERISKNKTKTHEQYIKEVKELSAHIEVKEEYKGSNTKILHYCTTHNIEWLILPSNILSGQGCKLCCKEKIIEKQKMSNEEYIRRLSEINSKITPIDEYVNFNTPILHMCLVCNHKWKTSPSSTIGAKSGCPNCARIKSKKERSFSKEEYIEKIKNSNVELIGDYINTMTKTKHKCKICGHIWNPYPGNLLKGHGCPKCRDRLTSERCKKSHDNFMNDFKDKSKFCDSIEILSQYTGSHDTIECKCLICNTYWTPLATNLLSGQGCPNCSQSYGERIISQILKKLEISYTPQKTFIDLLGTGNGLLSYDFYLSQYNLLIEFQGEQHEHPVEYFGGEKQFTQQQEHDRRKREYAEQHNINLLEIWYYDFDNIENILNETIKNLKYESVETVILA